MKETHLDRIAKPAVQQFVQDNPDHVGPFTIYADDWTGISGHIEHLPGGMWRADFTTTHVREDSPMRQHEHCKRNFPTSLNP